MEPLDQSSERQGWGNLSGASRNQNVAGGPGGHDLAADPGLRLARGAASPGRTLSGEVAAREAQSDDNPEGAGGHHRAGHRAHDCAGW
jgi:hypothetical protein